jgi:iron complex transport system ATP-binding protein
VLSIQNLHLSLGRTVLANGFNLNLKPGDVNVIIGPNGTGKSSLLRALFGELPIDHGEISLNGEAMPQKRIAQWRKHFGYMPQDIQLDVALSALEVVLLGRLDNLSLTLDEATLRQGLAALEMVGMLAYADQEVHTLSGGQRQMVLFAQVLLRQPTIMMLDEPISALDLHYQQVLLEQLVQQTKTNQWITLMVLHDLNLAAQFADRLIVLNQGEIKATGSPADVLTPALIENVYGVMADVLHDANGCPFIRTLRKTTQTQKTEKQNETV